MMVIPVLDLMNGQVVQGMRGEREHYRPLQSLLTPEACPLTVARALQAETGARALYIADLDAIQGRGDHRAVIREIADELNVELWVDAGVTDVASARRVLEAGATQVIIGSETLTNLETLRALKNAFPPDQLLFSLDIVNKRVLSQAQNLREQEPLSVLALLADEGWSQVILLTLDRVGTGSGLDWSLLRAARRAFSRLFLIAGGGVRTPDDLSTLAILGINAVLIASALHKGWIAGKDLRMLD